MTTYRRPMLHAHARPRYGGGGTTITPTAPAAGVGDREQVRRVAALTGQIGAALDQAPAFHRLPPHERESLRSNLKRITSYLSDPAAGLDGPARTRALRMAPPGPRALAGNNNKQTTLEAQSDVRGVNRPGGMDDGITNFNDDAAQGGADAMKDYMNAVKFPDFVKGLIKGVFDAVVKASIQQMQAYSEMLTATVKSVGEFANDKISMPQAQQHLQKKFPNIFDMVSMGEDGPQLKAKDSVDEMPDFKTAFGMEEEADPYDPDGLQKIVIAAQLDLARQRQQQLAAMMMLGINRIVVTDGRINAKVFIEVKTLDKSTRDRGQTRSQSDTKNRETTEHDSGDDGIWGTDSSDTHETRISSVNVDDTASNSDSKKLETKAQLTGEVALNFKSDYFPLEKLTSAGDLLKVQSASRPNDVGGTAVGA